MFHRVVAYGAHQMVMHRKTALHGFFDIFVVQVYHLTYIRYKKRAKTFRLIAQSHYDFLRLAQSHLLVS